MNPNIDNCIKCSICTALCPVFKATGLFPGPKLAGPDAERFRRGKAVPAGWLELCAYCKICERMCPHRVPVPELLLRSRPARKRGSRIFLRNWVFGHSYLFEKIGSWAAPAANRVLARNFTRWLLDRGLKIDGKARFPVFRRRTFVKWFRSRPKTGEGIPVAYFYGCFTNSFDPEIGKAVVGVLEKNGFRVVLPPQECCGLPLIANGFMKLASRLGEKNIDSLKSCAEKNMEVVFSSSSCGMTLVEEYRQVLNLPGAGDVGEHVFDIFQFLLRLQDQGKLNRAFREINETYDYHAPCHLRALGIGLPAVDLLSLIPGLRIRELPEGCCGLAGMYGLKKENFTLAEEIGRDLFRAIKVRKAVAVLSDCEACRMQIAFHTRAKTYHPIQILSRAYGG